jgi:hypothetical protein
MEMNQQLALDDHKHTYRYLLARPALLPLSTSQKEGLLSSPNEQGIGQASVCVSLIR